MNLSSAAAVVTVFWAAWLVLVVNGDLVNVPTPFTITPTNYYKSHFVQPGFIYGARDCGGTSRTLQITYDHCLPNVVDACAAPINRPGYTEAYFVATENAKDLYVRVSVVSEDEGLAKSFDFPVPGATLIAGVPYMLRGIGTSTSELLGKMYIGRIEILRESDNSVLLCAETDYLSYSDVRPGRKLRE